ncbi:MAG: tetratricopeptide repeat protein [Thermoguttaceae bacterium]
MSETQEAIERTKQLIEDVSLANKSSIRSYFILLAAVTLLPLFGAVAQLSLKVPGYWIGASCLIVCVIIYLVIVVRIVKLYLKSRDEQNKQLHVLDTEPTTAAEYIERGDVFYVFIEFEAALLDYEAALHLEPDNRKALNNCVVTAIGIPNNEKALVYAEALIEKNDAEYSPQGYHTKGAVLKETNVEMALNCYSKAIELMPDYHGAAFDKARLLLELNRLAESREALEVCSKIVQELVKKKEAYTGLSELHELHGILAMKQADYEAAVSAFSKAIKLEPEQHDYYEMRAEAYDNLGNFKKADADRKKAKELNFIDDCE